MPSDPRGSSPRASNPGGSRPGGSRSPEQPSALPRRAGGASGQARGYPPPEQGDEAPRTPSSSFFQSQNRAVRLALGAVGILVLAVCAALTVSVAAAVLPSLRATRQPTVAAGPDPTTVVSQFCDDEQSQRYTQAYALFSTHLQSQITQAQFVQRAQQLDTTKGTVSQCEPVQGGEASLTPTSESFDMAVGRTVQGTTTDYSGTIGVVKIGSAWGIDSLDASLGLT